MLASGFANASVSRGLVLWVVTGALLSSLTDVRVYLGLDVVPHLWRYGQWWRLLAWQWSYTNSTEVLFAAITLYNLRVVERMWGSRKFASFLIATLPYTALLPPLLFAFVLRPLSLGRVNRLPAGPTPVVFALLAQYYAAVPYTYRYRLASAGRSDASRASSDARRNPANRAVGDGDAAHRPWNRPITLTSKATSYLFPLQLSLAQLPGSLVAAMVGWAVGVAYRRDALPGGVAAWRISQAAGGRVSRRSQYREPRPHQRQPSRTSEDGFEGLRRRLEGEGEGAGASAREFRADGSEGRTRATAGAR